MSVECRWIRRQCQSRLGSPEAHFISRVSLSHLPNEGLSVPGTRSLQQWQLRPIQYVNRVSLSLSLHCHNFKFVYVTFVHTLQLNSLLYNTPMYHVLDPIPPPMHPHSGAHAILSLASTILSFHIYNFNLFHTLSLFTSLHLALYSHFTSSPVPSNITFGPPYYLDNSPLPFSISLLSSCTHIYTNTHTHTHMHTCMCTQY